MSADKDPFFPKETSKTSKEDWVKYLNEEAMNKMMKEVAEEESKTQDYTRQVMSDKVDESSIYVYPPPTPRKSISRFIKFVMKSTVVGPANDVISTSISEMNNCSTYTPMSNDHE